MRLMTEAEEAGLVLERRDLDWCEANRDAPESRAILDLVGLKLAGGFTPAHHQAARSAMADLRRVFPRPAFKADQIYAYVVYNPLTRVEAIPGILIGRTPSMLFGFELGRIRELMPVAREAQRGIPHPFKLCRFRFDRVVPDERIRYLTSENLKTKTAQEVFAYIGRAANGDETAMGWRDERGLDRVMVHADAEQIVSMLGVARTMRAEGYSVELRRFVRDGVVDDPEFDLRGEPRPGVMLRDAINL